VAETQLSFFAQHLKEKGMEHFQIDQLVELLSQLNSLHVTTYRRMMESTDLVQGDQITLAELSFVVLLLIPGNEFFEKVVKEKLDAIVKRHPKDQKLIRQLKEVKNSVKNMRSDFQRFDLDEEAEALSHSLKFLEDWEESYRLAQLSSTREEIRVSLKKKGASDTQLEDFDKKTTDKASFDSMKARQFTHSLLRLQQSKSHMESPSYAYQSPVSVSFSFPHRISMTTVVAIFESWRNQPMLSESDRTLLHYYYEYLHIRWGQLGTSLEKDYWSELLTLMDEELNAQTDELE
jgi:hypothetical protein